MESLPPRFITRKIAVSQHTYSAKAGTKSRFLLQPSRKIDWYDAGVVYPKTRAWRPIGLISRRLFSIRIKSGYLRSPCSRGNTIDGQKETLKAVRAEIETNSNRLGAHLVQCSGTVVEGYPKLDKEHGSGDSILSFELKTKTETFQVLPSQSRLHIPDLTTLRPRACVDAKMQVFVLTPLLRVS